MCLSYWNIKNLNDVINSKTAGTHISTLKFHTAEHISMTTKSIQDDDLILLASEKRKKTQQTIERH